MASSSTNAPLAMPTAEDVLVYGDRDGPNYLKPTQAWWRFFFGLYKRSQADVPFLVGSGLAAAGVAQGDALVLTTDWVEITSGGLNTGVVVANFGIGFGTWIWNTTGTTKKIYPPLGCAIDALGTNNPYSLVTAKAQIFSQLTAVQFRSLQLG